jgi:hypothetical protein
MGSGGIAPPSLTLALDGGEWSASRPGHFIPWEIDPGIHWIGEWVDPRVGLYIVEKRKSLPPPANQYSFAITSYSYSCLQINILFLFVYVYGIWSVTLSGKNMFESFES